MNAKKQRNKNRRRARKLAEQAWEAADDNNLDLAIKVIRRAVERNPGNPILWNDYGLLLRQANEKTKAAESFQAAISLAVDFAEAYANLGEIRALDGKTEQAVALQREAVRHAPESEQYLKTLTAYEALAGQSLQAPTRDSETKPNSGSRTARALITEFPALSARVDGLNWPAIEDRLTRHGYAHLPALLSPGQSAELRALFDDDARFSKTVTMAKSRFGKGVYRYFKAPIPSLVDATRRFFYGHASRIANAWQRLLDEDELYPANWDEFRVRCTEAGQTTPSPLLLRYEAGGFNALHQDIRGQVFFPLQLVIVLSPRADSKSNTNGGFGGGDFLFSDDPERKRSDRHGIPAGLGDAILFCTRARIVRVAGVSGLKSVRHGMDRVTSGTRYAIGIPFHEFE